MQKALRLAPITLIACLCASLSPQEKKPDVLELDTGRILKGRFESATGDTLQFHTSKGTLEVPRAQAVRLHFGRADDLGAPEGKGNPRAQAEAARSKQQQRPQGQEKGDVIKVPAGTPIAVRMEAEVRESDPPGGFVSANVTGNVKIGGRVAIPLGSRVFGRIVETGERIRMEFTEINIWGQSYPIHTTTQAGVTRSRMNARAAGGAAGAAIGHSVNGSKGAWIGLAVGAAAGNAMQDSELVVERDSIVEFRLNQPLLVKQ